MPGLLALKILLVPMLIVAITMAGRKWGAAVAGCLAGFPVVTGPILFFIAIEQGALFAGQAAVGATLAVLGNIGFGIAYSWISRRHAWQVSLAGGLAVYVCMVLLFNGLALSAWQAAAVTICGLLLASRLYPADVIDGAPARVPKSDLAYRVLAALALVLAVTIFSDRLGPRLSGLFAVFPVMASVLAVFSHRNLSQAFAVRLLRGMVHGFYAFTGFCFVLASTLDAYPPLLSFLMALVAAIFLQTVLMYLHAKRAGRALPRGAAPRRS